MRRLDKQHLQVTVHILWQSFNIFLTVCRSTNNLFPLEFVKVVVLDSQLVFYVGAFNWLVGLRVLCHIIQFQFVVITKYETVRKMKRWFSKVPVFSVRGFSFNQRCVCAQKCTHIKLTRLSEFWLTWQLIN